MPAQALRPRNSTSWEPSMIWMANCSPLSAPPQQGRKRLYMHSIAWWPTLIVLAVATFTDLHSRRIPNWLVLPFMLAGIGVSGWLHGWRGIGQSLSGLGLGALLLAVLYWLGGMGMGDLKLFAAIAGGIGPVPFRSALV